MKRIFACLLVLMVCVSLCACGNDEAMETYKKYEALIGYLESGDYENAYRELERLSGKKENEEEKAILGNWISMGGHEIIFREDGTVVMDGEGDRFEGKWMYSIELECYTIAMSMGMLNVFLKNDGQNSYVECRNMKFYTREAFEAKLPERLETARQEFSEKVEGMQKAQLDQVYTAEGFCVKFDIVLENGDFWIYATVTNLGTEPIQQIGGVACPIGVGYKRECYYYGNWRTISHGIEVNMAFAEGVEEIAPGETATMKGKLCDGVGKMLENYGVVLGYATCFIGEDNYYLDFSDYKIEAAA